MGQTEKIEHVVFVLAASIETICLVSFGNVGKSPFFETLSSNETKRQHLIFLGWALVTGVRTVYVPPVAFDASTSAWFFSRPLREPPVHREAP